MSCLIQNVDIHGSNNDITSIATPNDSLNPMFTIRERRFVKWG